MEDKPTAIGSACGVLGSPPLPKTPHTSPTAVEVKNHLSPGGICIDRRRWKAFGSTVPRCSPTDTGSIEFKR